MQLGAWQQQRSRRAAERHRDLEALGGARGDLNEGADLQGFPARQGRLQLILQAVLANLRQKIFKLPKVVPLQLSGIRILHLVQQPLCAGMAIGRVMREMQIDWLIATGCLGATEGPTPVSGLMRAALQTHSALAQGPLRHLLKQKVNSSHWRVCCCPGANRPLAQKSIAQSHCGSSWTTCLSG